MVHSMRYYSTQRPIGPGTFPRQGGTEKVVNYDGPTYCEEIGREAWGYPPLCLPLRFTSGQSGIWWKRRGPPVPCWRYLASGPRNRPLPSPRPRGSPFPLCC
ncbi:MAG: hypothetical protein ACLRSY_09750 [Acutalibacter sp.]